jgi:hypothetical protein
MEMGKGKRRWLKDVVKLVLETVIGKAHFGLKIVKITGLANGR